MIPKRLVIVGIILSSIISILCSSIIFSQNQMTKMYYAEKVDGCEDFHCTKCIDRDNCTLNFNCSIDNCGHKHGAVLCGESIIFYLRSSNGYTNANGDKDCEARAFWVAEALNSSMEETMMHDSCKFIVRNEKGASLNGTENPTIWMDMGMGNKIKIVTITNSDMLGYKARAKMLSFSKMAKASSSITKKMVAYWWASNLEDHFAMMALNKKPSRTVKTHCGKVLMKVWEQAKEIVPEGKIPMETFRFVMKNLSVDEKRHLKLAAQIIPMNYKPIIN